jgi:murein DD-endopeptidase MepM/ murein hydrolase activator NlpD
MATRSFSVLGRGLRKACLLGLTAVALQSAPFALGSAQAGVNDLFPTNRTAGGFITDGGVYDVVQGDTLYGISKRFGVSIASIKAANDLNTDLIGPHTLLKIPGVGSGGGLLQHQTSSAGAPNAAFASNRSYTVQTGDTLYKISIANKVSVRDLSAINQLKSGDRIHVGQVLMLPAKPGGLGQLTAKKELEPQGSSSFGGLQGQTQVASLGRNLSVPKPVRKPAAVSASKQVASAASLPTPTPVATNSSLTPPAAPSMAPTNAGSQVAKKQDAAPAPAKQSGGSSLMWPVRGQLLESFGLKSGGVKVDGITIAVNDGEPIKAAGDGLVMYSGSVLADFGQLLLIKHDNGLITAYAHNKSISVKKGQRVTAGQVVALAGQSGKADRPQLHFQVRENGKPVNPLPFLTR